MIGIVIYTIFIQENSNSARSVIIFHLFNLLVFLKEHTTLLFIFSVLLTLLLGIQVL